MFLEATLFTGSEPIYSFGVDFYQGVPFPRELREKEQRLTTQSPNSTDPESLIVITEHISHIINNDDLYSRKEIIKDLNSIDISSVSDMHFYF